MKRTAFEITYRTPANTIATKTVRAETADLAVVAFKSKHPEARNVGVALKPTDCAEENTDA
jgi:hypothetical protein